MSQRLNSGWVVVSRTRALKITATGNRWKWIWKTITDFVGFIASCNIELEDYIDSLDVDKILAIAIYDDEDDDPVRTEQFKQHYLG